MCFGRLKLAELEHLRAVDDRVHQDVLVQTETPDIVPAEDLVLREHVVIADHLLVLHADFFIYIVCDDHIDFRVRLNKAFDRVEDLKERILIHPVVAVHNLKILSGGVLQTAVDSVAVSSVFFFDSFYDRGVLFLIALGYFLRAVFGTVVDHEDLNVFPANEDGVDRLFHIGFRIIARYGK